MAARHCILLRRREKLSRIRDKAHRSKYDCEMRPTPPEGATTMADSGPRKTRWQRYYDAAGAGPPRATLLRALELFKACKRTQPGFALDLGCGTGRDTLALLQQHWRVLAVDAEPHALEQLRARVSAPFLSALCTRTTRFEALDWPREVDLVNSSFALPLCAPQDFARVWTNLSEALTVGGRFCGQLFGPRDSWAGQPGITHHQRSALTAVFAPFELEYFDEEESDVVTPRGTAKHWHIYHVVARKR